MIKKISSFRQHTLQIIGVIGALFCLALFIYEPSFPTPDKLLIFLLFVFMAFHQSIEMLKRFVPFVAVILAYESFRGLAHSLNSHVNYSLAPHIDKLFFGNLPTIYLQNWLWHGQTRWYDFLFYIPYMLFFVLPFALAILIWKTRPKYYWQTITAYCLTFFGAFFTFLLFPAAPPWLAAEQHVIEPITRISSNVWSSLGIHDFSLLYSHIAPNPVAAIPSLHAATATLFSLIIFKLYGRNWGSLSLLYPLLIFIGVVYQGEHYVFDVALGAIYAVAAYLITPWFMVKCLSLYRFTHRKARQLKAVKY